MAREIDTSTSARIAPASCSASVTSPSRLLRIATSILASAKDAGTLIAGLAPSRTSAFSRQLATSAFKACSFSPASAEVTASPSRARWVSSALICDSNAAIASFDSCGRVSSRKFAR